VGVSPPPFFLVIYHDMCSFIFLLAIRSDYHLVLIKLWLSQYRIAYITIIQYIGMLLTLIESFAKNGQIIEVGGETIRPLKASIWRSQVLIHSEFSDRGLDMAGKTMNRSLNVYLVHFNKYDLLANP